MAQKKINPTAFRLTVKQTWWSISDTSFLYQDIFIRKLIKGTFKSFNILTSQVGIKRKGKHIFIDLLVFPYNSYYNQKEKFLKNPNFPHIKLPALLPEDVLKNNPNISYRGIWSLIKSAKIWKKSSYLNGNFQFRYSYVTSLLELLLNKRFESTNIISISVTQAPSLTSNAQILCEWIDLEIRKTPLKHKLVLNRAKNYYLELQENSKKENNYELYEKFKETLKKSW